MKPKQIIIIVIAFIVLAVIYSIQKSTKHEVIQGLGYEKVLGDELATSDIIGFKCYFSGHEDKALHLVNSDDVWVVKNKFDAPANDSKVKELKEKLENLKGDIRSSSEDVLADYEIDDENAVHLVLLDENGAEKKHLLLGKQGEDWRSMFLRLNGSNDVYMVGENLRSLFGLYSEKKGDEIDSKQWCDLKIMDIKKDDLKKVEIEAPHKSIVLELVEKFKPVIDSATDVESSTVEKEWVLVEPEIAEPKEAGIERILGAFSNLSVSDILDKGKFDTYGLDNPTAKCTIVTQYGEVDNLLIGNSVPGGNGAYYAALDGNDFVYKMDRWKLDAIFLKMSSLEDISSTKFTKDDINNLSFEFGDKSFGFEKDEDEWITKNPDISINPKSSFINKALQVVSEFRPQDYPNVDAPDVIGIEEPSLIVTFSEKDGVTHKIIFGNSVPLTSGDRFVKIDNKKVCTITESNWKSVEPEIKNIFDLKVFDFDTNEVNSLTLNDASGELKLGVALANKPDSTEEVKEQWVDLMENEPVNGGRVSLLLGTMKNNLIADDIYEKVEDAGFEKPTWSVEFSFIDGNSDKLIIGNMKDSGSYYAKTGSGKAVYSLPKFQVERLMRLSPQLRNSE